MTGSKIYLLFCLPAFFDMYFKMLTTGEFQYNVNYIIIALVSYLIGSTAQGTAKNKINKLKFKDWAAIYSTGLIIAVISYWAGVYYDSYALTGISSVIVSYFSIEFLDMVTETFKAIMKRVPNIFSKLATDIAKYIIGKK